MVDLPAYCAWSGRHFEISHATAYLIEIMGMLFSKNAIQENGNFLLV